MKERDRDRFEAEELAVVLSHYDLGVIESVTEFSRGSRKSPKVGIVAQRGKFLLKKRAFDRRSDRRIVLAHAVQKRLEGRGFPLARLIAVRGGDDTCVQRGGDIYELFEFLRGDHYGGTTGQTRSAGAALAQFHHATAGVDSANDAPSGSYHDVIGVRTSLNAIPTTISSHDSVAGYELDLASVIEALFDAYDRGADAVNEAGFGSLPVGVAHGDWHPGNLLFQRDDIVGAIDYDSCRIAQRVTDIANGALQFSLAGGGDVGDWPDHADMERFVAFVAGYRSVVVIDDIECACIPHLMIEALIAEAVLPIAHTGSFGRFTGFGVLRMVDRKVRWMAGNHSRIASVLRG